MFKILKKEELSPSVYSMDIEAPRVAKKCLAGQFIILRVDEEGERIPLTIANFDRKKGKIVEPMLSAYPELNEEFKLDIMSENSEMK